MSSSRRSNKPLMEKRRRARINDCLSQLKTLVLQAMKKDTNQYSKLEKADILEMTVKHLKSMQRQQSVANVAADPFLVSKYRAGFNECASEVSRFLVSSDHINPEIREHMLSHLANCLNRVPAALRHGHHGMVRTPTPQSSPIEQIAMLHNSASGYMYMSDPSQVCGIPTNSNTSLSGYTSYNHEHCFPSDGEDSRQGSIFYGDDSRGVSEELKNNDYVTFPGCYSLDRTSSMSASLEHEEARHGREIGQRQSLSPSRPGSASGLSDSMWRPW